MATRFQRTVDQNRCQRYLWNLGHAEMGRLRWATRETSNPRNGERWKRKEVRRCPTIDITFLIFLGNPGDIPVPLKSGSLTLILSWTREVPNKNFKVKLCSERFWQVYPTTVLKDWICIQFTTPSPEPPQATSTSISHGVFIQHHFRVELIVIHTCRTTATKKKKNQLFHECRNH